MEKTKRFEVIAFNDNDVELENETFVNAVTTVINILKNKYSRTELVVKNLEGNDESTWVIRYHENVQETSVGEALEDAIDFDYTEMWALYEDGDDEEVIDYDSDIVTSQEEAQVMAMWLMQCIGEETSYVFDEFDEKDFQ